MLKCTIHHFPKIQLMLLSLNGQMMWRWSITTIIKSLNSCWNYAVNLFSHLVLKAGLYLLVMRVREIYHRTVWNYQSGKKFVFEFSVHSRTNSKLENEIFYHLAGEGWSAGWWIE